MFHFKNIYKLLVSLLILILIFPACRTEISLYDENFDSRLNVFCYGFSDSLQTKVYVSETFISRRPREVKDANVKLYVNNKEVYSVNKVTSIDEDVEQSYRIEDFYYPINYKFKEGDKVKLVVQHANYPKKAISELIVPKKPNVPVLDLKESTLNEYIERDFEVENNPKETKRYWEDFKAKLKLKDIAGETNFYRLKLLFYYKEKDIYYSHRFHYEDDFILMDGRPRNKEQGDKLSFEGIMGRHFSNSYAVFSDRLFHDGEGLMNINFSCPRFKDKSVHMKLVVEQIPALAYDYLLVMSRSQSYNPMVTPSTIPSSFEGGVGLFVIASESAVEFTLPVLTDEEIARRIDKKD